MKVTYLEGDTEQFGYVFADGKPVEVTDAAHLAKFRGNPFFAVEGEDAKPQPVGLHAVHKGRGVFAIMEDADERMTGLDKSEAEIFNAMSEEDQRAYLASSN